MAGTRAFKHLANLRSSFEEPLVEDSSSERRLTGQSFPDAVDITSIPFEVKHRTPALLPPHEYGPQPVSPITGKVDGRRLRKVLKTPSVSLSVAVRAELHEQIGEMLFARKMTWIALLDQLLDEYVAKAKETGHYPK